jgi:hypothetical protein
MPSHALTMTKNLNRSRYHSFSSKAMDNFNEQLFEMIGRCRSVSNGRGSRAAAIIGKECQMIVSNNPTRSKTASITGINKAKVIALYKFKWYQILDRLLLTDLPTSRYSCCCDFSSLMSSSSSSLSSSPSLL